MSRDEVIEVLSQHVTLSKVFEALFQGDYEPHNPVALELDRTVDKLRLKEKLEGLDDFYDEALRELKLATTRVARQNFIRKLYENFYKSLDPEEQARHGIVFTPIEVVDFIVNSTSYLLKRKFGVEFGGTNVKVIDPFTGTGSFIVRLLELGLIPDDRMYHKYKKDLYANDIKLLSHYVAAVNIETTYASLRRGGKYVDFPGMSYTDTFTIDPEYRGATRAERAAAGTQSGLDGYFQAAHDGVRRQRGSHIHVVMGNPPYKADVDIKYEGLDGKIKTTYEDSLYHTEKKNKKLLYDSYIRALRWASTRIEGSGIVAFVINGSFLRSGVGTGIRAVLEREFNEIWCFDLRGDQTTQGELSQKEGGKIFGANSKQPVSITLLLKILGTKGCKIYYKDIGDYLDRKEKLQIISKYGSIEGIPARDWKLIEPDQRHDWVDKVEKDEFFRYLEMGNATTKFKASPMPNAIFKEYSRGVITACDPVAYNFNKRTLSNNIRRHIDYCGKQDLDNWVDDKSMAIKDSKLIDRLKSYGHKPFDGTKIRRAAYRPFFDQYVYFDKVYNQSHYKINKFFPSSDSSNMLIYVPTKIKNNFSVIVTDKIPDLHIVNTGQCFPLYYYVNGVKFKNITKYASNTFQKCYNDRSINEMDIFDYVYAILHHVSYRNQFSNNLKKYLPRIPLVRDIKNFWEFKNAGTNLRDLHLKFDNCPKAKLGRPLSQPKNFTRIILKKSADKKTVAVYADKFLIFENLAVPRYRVNGRTPLEWVADRYQKTVKHGVWINDPCADVDIISVIERAVYLGQRTDELVDSLPRNFEPSDNWPPTRGGLDEHLGL